MRLISKRIDMRNVLLCRDFSKLNFARNVSKLRIPCLKIVTWHCCFILVVVAGGNAGDRRDDEGDGYDGAGSPDGDVCDF